MWQAAVGAGYVAQLEHLALQLRSKSADDPQLHAAALDYAEWVEKGQMPEESLESQLAWQVLEHCSGTPGPLDLPTLAAFADIANEAHAPGQLQPLTIAVANVTKWRPEILRWYQHTQAACLLAQETHLSLEQEAKAKATLLSEGLHSFWAEPITEKGVLWLPHPGRPTRAWSSRSVLKGVVSLPLSCLGCNGGW